MLKRVLRLTETSFSAPKAFSGSIARIVANSKIIAAFIAGFTLSVDPVTCSEDHSLSTKDRGPSAAFRELQIMCPGSLTEVAWDVCWVWIKLALRVLSMLDLLVQGVFSQSVERQKRFF